MWQIFWVSSVVLFPLLAFSAGEAVARPQLQLPEGEVYIVQADDRLSKIAEKYYQDATFSSFIVQATTAKAMEDPSFTPLPNSDLLEIGQKLWLPPHEGLASATPQPPSLSQVAEISLPADTLVFSPDDKLLALDSWDESGAERFIQVWDTETWQLSWGQDKARYITFSPDGQYLATIISDTVCLCEASTGNPLSQLLYKGIYEVAFSTDGERLANAVGASWEGKVILWNVNTGQLIAEFKHDLPIYNFELSPNGSWLAVMTVGSWGPIELDVWDIATHERRTLAKLEALPNNSNVVFSPDAKWLAARIGYEAPITIWATQTWSEVAHLETSSGSVSDLTFSPDGRWLVAVVFNGETEILIWDLSTWQVVTQLQPAESIFGVAFSPDGQWLAAGVYSEVGQPLVSEGQLWEVATGKLVARMPHAHQVQGLAFSHNGQWIATGSTDRTVRVWAMPAKEN